VSDSVFTKIRKSEIPGIVLHEDAECFVILSNMPHNPGHLLVIPTKEVADWYDLDPETYSHLMLVAKYFGKATKEIYNCPKVSLVSVGFDVAHVHIHVFSLFEISDIDHENAKPATMEQRKIEADKFRKYISSTEGIK
jgi:diadenosine tetraphosphate (Ap4A) HIT family hydrolase